MIFRVLWWFTPLSYLMRSPYYFIRTPLGCLLSSHIRILVPWPIKNLIWFSIVSWILISFLHDQEQSITWKLHSPYWILFKVLLVYPSFPQTFFVSNQPPNMFHHSGIIHVFHPPNVQTPFLKGFAIFTQLTAWSFFLVLGPTKGILQK